MERFVDFIYLIYFGTHIPITVLFDSQVFLPSWLYPDKVRITHSVEIRLRPAQRDDTTLKYSGFNQT